MKVIEQIKCKKTRTLCAIKCRMSERPQSANQFHVYHTLSHTAHTKNIYLNLFYGFIMIHGIHLIGKIQNVKLFSKKLFFAS